MSVDFKKSGCNGNQSLRQRGTFVHIRETHMHYGMAALRVFCKMSGTIIIFRDVSRRKNWKDKSRPYFIES